MNNFVLLKPQNCVVNVLKLKTLRDDGILDPDDYIEEVVEDKELVSLKNKIILIQLFKFFKLF